jgi:hypothetical protein
MAMGSHDDSLGGRDFNDDGMIKVDQVIGRISMWVSRTFQRAISVWGNKTPGGGWASFRCAGC